MSSDNSNNDDNCKVVPFSDNEDLHDTSTGQLTREQYCPTPSTSFSPYQGGLPDGYHAEHGSCCSLKVQDEMASIPGLIQQEQVIALSSCPTSLTRPCEVDDTESAPDSPRRTSCSGAPGSRSGSISSGASTPSEYSTSPYDANTRHVDMASQPPRTSLDSTSSSSGSDIYAYLHARLSNPLSPSSSGTCTSSSVSTSSSTTRGSSQASTPTTPKQYAYSFVSTCSTTPKSASSATSTRPSSGSSTPKRSHYYKSTPSPPSSSSSRHSSSSSSIRSKFRKSIGSPPLSSSSTSDGLSRLVSVQHAISASVYIFIATLAALTLVAFVVTGYGLTLADDARKRLQSARLNVRKSRRRILFKLGTRARQLNDLLIYRNATLESSIPNTSNSSSGQSSSAYPHQNQGSNLGATPAHDKDTKDQTLRHTILVFGTILAVQSYHFVAAQSFVPSFLKTSTAYGTTAKRDAQRSHTPLNTSEKRPAFSNESPRYQSGSNSTTEERKNRDYFPPRPPLRHLIPSIILALLLGMIAFVKTSNSRKSAARKQ